MRVMMCAVAAALGLVAFGEVKKLSDADLQLIRRSYKELNAEERIRRGKLIELKDMIDNGGRLVLPGTPYGTIRIVNLQKRVPKNGLVKVLNPFRNSLDYDIAIVDSDCEATMTIRLVDDDKTPLSTVYPEDLKATINVGRLGADNPKPEVYAARIRKMILRTFACLTAGSAHGTPLYTRVRHPSDLDDVAKENFPIDVSTRANLFLQDAGLKPYERCSYREALTLGKQIAPTNEYQKAIWDKVHAPPTKPIKISYDKAAQKPVVK